MLFMVSLIMVFAMTLGMTTANAAPLYYNYFEKPENNTTYKVDDTIEISVWAGAVITNTKFDAWGNPTTVTYETMPATIKVLKGNKEVHSESFTYQESTRIEMTYTPKEEGDYTIELYGRPAGLGTTGEVLHDQVTVKVDKKDEPIEDASTDKKTTTTKKTTAKTDKKTTASKTGKSTAAKVKKANTLKVKARTAKVKYSKVKKKAQTLAVTRVIKFIKKGQGKITYSKVSGNKKITINKKTGKVKVKKGLKKGTYRVKLKMKAAGNKNYKSLKKTVTVKIVVK